MIPIAHGICFTKFAQFCLIFVRLVSFRSIKRDDLLAYINKHYSAPRMVLAAAGGQLVFRT